MTVPDLLLLWLALSCFCTAGFLWLMTRSPLRVGEADLHQLASDWEDEV